MPNRRRNLSVMIMLILGLGLIVATGLVAGRLAEQTNPEDTSATGFGPTATRDLFNTVHYTFAGVRCETFFNESHIQYLPESADITQVELIEEIAPNNNLAKYCKYDLGDGRTITFSVVSYVADSDIDNTRSELYSRVNGTLLTDSVVFASANWFDVDYFLGQDALDVDECRTNLFHFQNDFEFASITYTGFSPYCEELIDLNDSTASIFSEDIAAIMDTINLEAGVTFQDLFLDYEFID